MVLGKSIHPHTLLAYNNKTGSESVAALINNTAIKFLSVKKNQLNHAALLALTNNTTLDYINIDGYISNCSIK